MTYQYRLHKSGDEVDAAAWESVQRYDPFPFTDLRFLRVVERTLQDQATCWPVLITNEDGHPMAVTCLSLFRVDGSILAGPMIRRASAHIRKIRPQFLWMPILLCGLPVSTGQSSVAMCDDADSQAVADALLRAIIEVEQRVRPRLTIAKEFEDQQAAQLRSLTESGFLEVDSLPMHDFPVLFTDFDDYHRQRGRRSRSKLRKSRKKLQEAGVQVKHLRGGDGALDMLTDDVHRLYAAVHENSDTNFEFLPLEFFRELARQFPEDSCFTFLMRGDDIAAFTLRVTYRNRVHLMFLGIDYAHNRDLDLYFNALYEDLDAALKQQPTAIYFGQGSETVKLRIGCGQSRRTLFVRGHRLWRPLVKAFSPFAFPKVDPQPSRLATPSREELSSTSVQE